MKVLEKGEEKVQQICKVLKKETLEPAQKEAERIIEDAKKRGDELISQAQKEAETLLSSTRAKIEQEKRVFLSSLDQAGKQAFETLKQNVESKLFREQLAAVIQEKSADPQVIARFLTTIIEAIEKEGLSVDVTAMIPRSVEPKEVCQFIGKRVLDQLKEENVVVGDFDGGFQVKLHEQEITVDFSAATLLELLARYVRKDFRKFLFTS